MEKEFSIFDFLKNYASKKLISIQSAPQWPEEGKHVSDEVTLNFSDGSQLVISSSFDDVDIFFAIDEDVVFSIEEASGHEPFCNIGDTPITTILVNEEIVSIKVYFDEVTYADRSISEKCLTYPVGLFIRTSSRSIGICKDYIEAAWLDADYSEADEGLLFSIDDCWEGYDEGPTFVVKRMVKDYITDKITQVEERKFC